LKLSALLRIRIRDILLTHFEYEIGKLRVAQLLRCYFFAQFLPTIGSFRLKFPVLVEIMVVLCRCPFFPFTCDALATLTAVSGDFLEAHDVGKLFDVVRLIRSWFVPDCEVVVK